MFMSLVVAACALLDRDNRVLLARRPEGKAMAGLWEFPGGKVEVGETPEEALIRELDEELGVAATKPCLAPLSFASHGEAEGHLLLLLYVCRRWQASMLGLQPGREGQALKWVRPRDLRAYPMPPANAPLVAHIMDLLA